ncbi:MAG: tRNA uridine-5-carboxymethylaminomethyl(34) synthesis GTPase MnmE [candidate division WOR-3 bacterium]|nr:tRNA uridine-5-carboxymethylaminomethyl(34) synthesis GTPase MnmE [candidate division WOR-3 bacterium]MDW8151204.1 tRNA uridine-5-carboxymethylaminomethyl(34) synthesis GTPase MnmE [candidate division WOR-3 bacterium]
MLSDTIVAISSGYGVSAISVIRVSGPLVLSIIEKVFRRKLKNRYATYLKFYNNNGKVIDDVIAVYYKSPKSYTGEDMLEIFCHGGLIIPKLILREIVELGARQAEPGEFTKRAFLNGKLDLIQSSTINEIINAKSESAIYSLRSRMDGVLSRKLEDLRESLLDLLKEIEARIDFEEDVPEISKEEVFFRIKKILNMLEDMLKNSASMEKVSQGINVVIIGKANVGKSSIFNKLLGYERAIVSEIPGTTRDYISEYLVIDGITFRIVDTAGIREAQDIIEKIGIEKSLNLTKFSDIIIFVLSAEKIETYELELLERIPNEKLILVINKSEISRPNIEGYKPIYLSVYENFGFEELKNTLYNKAISEISAEYYFSRSEYETLQYAYNELIEVLNLKFEPLDIISHHIRLVVNSLSRLLGIEDLPEEILNRVFRDFCIGK